MKTGGMSPREELEAKVATDVREWYERLRLAYPAFYRDIPEKEVAAVAKNAYSTVVLLGFEPWWLNVWEAAMCQEVREHALPPMAISEDDIPF